MMHSGSYGVLHLVKTGFFPKQELLSIYSYIAIFVKTLGEFSNEYIPNLHGILLLLMLNLTFAIKTYQKASRKVLQEKNDPSSF
jgi:hypothetical protein